uniref:hypothetical protein n=1 Tax=Stenotrophomonas sp. SrG TaxID=3414430 RepID=UPI003CEFE142
RALRAELARFAPRPRLATAYTDHPRALPRSGAGRAFAAALGNQIRARTAWMVEVARPDGVRDAATHAALDTAHARLDPGGQQ